MAVLSKPELTVSMDYGTRTLCVSYSISDSERGDTPLAAINFNRKPHIIQEVAWLPDGTFIFGDEVSSKVRAREIQPGDVIMQWKLCLCPEFQHRDIAKHVYVQLQRYGKSLEQLLAEHIRAVLRRIKEVFKKGARISCEYSSEEIDAMTVNLLLSVPQMWEPPECQRMATAAKEAGVDSVKILFEPQCAAAYLLDDVVESRSLTGSMRLGSVTIVADPGGGTGDFVTFEITKGEGDSKYGLKQVGAARGSLCGSEFVGFRFLKYLTTTACDNDEVNKTFEERCDDLGRTKEDVYSLALEMFNLRKETFSGDALEPVNVWISGKPGTAQESSSWKVTITCDQMKLFFQPVIDEIIGHIDGLLRELRKKGKSVTHIAIVGGMRGSPFFMDQINDKYETSYKIIGDGDEEWISTHAVAHGSHMRYNDIKNDDMRPVGYFGVERDEVFDENIHTDVYTVHHRTGKKIFRDGLSFESNGQRIVSRRWQQVDTESRAIDLMYLVRPKEVQKVLVLQIWWTHEKIANGEPFLTKDGTHDREDVIRFGRPLVKQCLDWKAEGFEPRHTEEFDLARPRRIEQEEDEKIDAINDHEPDSDYSPYDDDSTMDDDPESEDDDPESEDDDPESEDDDPESEDDDPESASKYPSDDEDSAMEVDVPEPEQSEGIQETTAETEGPRPDEIFAPTPTEAASINDAELNPMEVLIEGVDEELVLEDGRPCKLIGVYEVYTRLTVISDGANTSIKWVVVKPGTQPFDEMGKPKKDKKQAMQVLGEEDVVELIDAAFSPYARG